MPNAGKWWILTPKEKLNKTWAYLNKEVTQYMQQNLLDNNHMPLCDIPLKNTAKTVNIVNTSKYTNALLMHMQRQPTPTLIHKHPPPTGRIGLYALVIEQQTVIVITNSTQGYGPPSHTAELLEIEQVINSIQSRAPRVEDRQIKDMNIAINKLKTAATLTTSTLTDFDGSRINLLQGTLKKQEQQL